MICTKAVLNNTWPYSSRQIIDIFAKKNEQANFHVRVLFWMPTLGLKVSEMMEKFIELLMIDMPARMPYANASPTTLEYG